MRAPLLVILSVALTLGGCSTVRESRLNPFNWFGGSTVEVVAVAPGQAAADPRPLADLVVEMSVERTPGGAIIQATGRPPRQGFWMADLVRDPATPDKAGVIVYDFRVAPPDQPTRAGTEPSREVTAGAFLSTQDLEGVRAIVVRGARNQQRSSR
ncbi:hypothetical protein [Rhodovulum euryhalinum]|uniref:Lipoprotein n=1 Tax=Rhodovulum euryhalinum TaxID=35805 RepID=A0A4R2KGC4_9RHOB|nr:hypothetical protein [Rhodovulum euryhalinum]TCO69018.1 hypothetical protein EV655_11915 [Rhodovulum euryhalinum]